MRIMENKNKNSSCFGGRSMPKYAEEILAAVTELQRHPTAEQVFLEMKKEHPSIALGTVYKHLNGLAEEGLLHRKEVQSYPYRFYSPRADRHRLSVVRR